MPCMALFSANVWRRSECALSRHSDVGVHIRIICKDYAMTKRNGAGGPLCFHSYDTDNDVMLVRVKVRESPSLLGREVI